MKIFDTHAHYSDSKYDEDREELFKKMYIEGVDRICLIGPNLSETKEEKAIIQKYKDMDGIPKFCFTAGDHPDEIIKEKPDSEKGVKHLADFESELSGAVAVGEIGLDYFGDGKDENTYKHQKEWFIAFLELAKKLHLPIVVHSRDACKDTLDIIKTYGKDLTGIIHCFSYEKEIANEYIKMGYYIGIGGALTFKNNRKNKEVVENIPIESIVTETDCPWLAPTPHRGERNESDYIKLVIDEIARLKGTTADAISDVLYKNALDVYDICD